MLDPHDADHVQKLFGATEAQVRRDHAISHVLAAIKDMRAGFVFYGGTALSRTLLDNGRLSEDIDLFSESRRELCLELDELPDLIEQEFPQAEWERLPSHTADVENTNLNLGLLNQIKVQVADSRSRGWQKIPTELMEIDQRYSDVEQTHLLVPTLDGFVAMKALAWFDRGTPRDLFDLEGLSHLGAVTETARELVRELRGFRLSRGMLNRRVSGLWYEELANQTRLEKTEQECLTRLLGWWGE